MKRALVAALFLMLGQNVAAYQFGTPTSVSGLGWTITGYQSSFGYGSGGPISMAITGDFAHSSNFLANGVLITSSTTGINFYGSGSINANGIGFNIVVGSNSWICQVDARTLNGTCNVLTPVGVVLGTLFLTAQ